MFLDGVNQFFINQKVGSMVSLPIYEDGKRKHQITLVWETPHSIDDELQRILSAIRAQVAVCSQKPAIYATNTAGRERISATG